MTLTVGLAGPSGKVQSKLPAPVVALNVSGPTWVPPVPQLGRVEHERVRARIGGGEAVGVARALVGRRSSPVRVTVGATLATVTVWVAVLLSVPSQSSTCTETVELGRAVGEGADEAAAPVVVLKVAGPTWLPLAPQSVDDERERRPRPGRWW